MRLDHALLPAFSYSFLNVSFDCLHLEEKWPRFVEKLVEIILVHLL